MVNRLDLDVPRSKFFSLILSLIILLSAVMAGARPAWAHRPHHVVTHVALSPGFDEDNTVFIVVRNNLYKSTNSGDSWQRLVQGLDYEEISDLRVSAQSRDVLYLSTRGDGVYQSTDAGRSWTQRTNSLRSLNLGAIAVSPNNANRVLVAGQEGGLYRSDNGGEAWQSVWMDNRQITAIAFSNDRPNTIFVGTHQGELHRSDDGGETWVRLSQLNETGSITAIAPSPTFSRDSQLWLGTEAAGVWWSTDGGNQLTALDTDIPDPYITDLLAVSQGNNSPELLLSTWDAGFFHSLDGGQTWMTAQDGLDKDRQADELKEPHFYTLDTSPAAWAKGLIFLGGFNGLYRSDNGGQQWQSLETLSPNIVTAFAISPNYAEDHTLAIGTYVNGIYLTRDSGENWVRSSRGLHLPWFTNTFEEQYQDPRRYFHAAFSPNYAEDKTLFVSILWTKLLRSTDAGESWKVISLPSEVRGVTILVSPNFAEDQTVYVAGQQGEFFRSEDGGRHFQEVANIGVPSGNDAPALVASPNFLEDGVLLATGPGGIYRSSDRAETWEHLTPDAAWETRRHLQLAISPNYREDQTIFVGTNSGVFWSLDAGASWDVVPGLANLADGYVEAIAVSPEFARDQTVMVTIRGRGLWRSTDGGQSFSQTGDNQLLFSKIDRIPSAGMAIQFSPNYDQDNTLYAMGDTTTTLYRSRDQGTSWETLRVPDLALANPSLGDQVQIYFHVYRGRVFRFGLAVVLGLVSYGVLSWFTRRRSLPIPRPVLPVIGTIVVFSGSLVVLLN
ncbi:hypothetical protein NEA10_18705 [Phormidium yuhuli AB48]|uniref:Photosynthesis system II assembly factor Ycf48/Hcf136-like domain-containing protein n=1 Tax=Phormidium yuhuli AB48 TaxID=2940671 RepID=A0ABY5ANR7_9CYAN|nr:YCF48-related protein [Phormidium yuhuli]USR90827.1 hypothetical protein NEA10_18705 [Phormidium yuhuli AB48]